MFVVDFNNFIFIIYESKKQQKFVIIMVLSFRIFIEIKMNLINELLY